MHRSNKVKKTHGQRANKQQKVQPKTTTKSPHSHSQIVPSDDKLITTSPHTSIRREITTKRKKLSKQGQITTKQLRYFATTILPSYAHFQRSPPTFLELSTPTVLGSANTFRVKTPPAKKTLQSFKNLTFAHLLQHGRTSLIQHRLDDLAFALGDNILTKLNADKIKVAQEYHELNSPSKLARFKSFLKPDSNKSNQLDIKSLGLDGTGRGAVLSDKFPYITNHIHAHPDLRSIYIDAIYLLGQIDRRHKNLNLYTSEDDECASLHPMIAVLLQKADISPVEHSGYNATKQSQTFDNLYPQSHWISSLFSSITTTTRLDNQFGKNDKKNKPSQIPSINDSIKLPHPYLQNRFDPLMKNTTNTTVNDAAHVDVYQAKVDTSPFLQPTQQSLSHLLQITPNTIFIRGRLHGNDDALLIYHSIQPVTQFVGHNGIHEIIANSAFVGGIYLTESNTIETTVTTPVMPGDTPHGVKKDTNAPTKMVNVILPAADQHDHTLEAPYLHLKYHLTAQMKPETDTFEDLDTGDDDYNDIDQYQKSKKSKKSNNNDPNWNYLLVNDYYTTKYNNSSIHTLYRQLWSPAILADVDLRYGTRAGTTERTNALSLSTHSRYYLRHTLIDAHDPLFILLQARPTFGMIIPPQRKQLGSTFTNAVANIIPSTLWSHDPNNNTNQSGDGNGYPVMSKDNTYTPTQLSLLMANGLKSINFNDSQDPTTGRLYKEHYTVDDAIQYKKELVYDSMLQNPLYDKYTDEQLYEVLHGTTEPHRITLFESFVPAPNPNETVESMSHFMTYAYSIIWPSISHTLFSCFNPLSDDLSTLFHLSTNMTSLATNSQSIINRLQDTYSTVEVVSLVKSISDVDQFGNKKITVSSWVLARQLKTDIQPFRTHGVPSFPRPEDRLPAVIEPFQQGNVVGYNNKNNALALSQKQRHLTNNNDSGQLQVPTDERIEEHNNHILNPLFEVTNVYVVGAVTPPPAFTTTPLPSHRVVTPTNDEDDTNNDDAVNGTKKHSISAGKSNPKSSQKTTKHKLLLPTAGVDKHITPWNPAEDTRLQHRKQGFPTPHPVSAVLANDFPFLHYLGDPRRPIGTKTLWDPSEIVEELETHYNYETKIKREQVLEMNKMSDGSAHKRAPSRSRQNLMRFPSFAFNLPETNKTFSLASGDYNAVHQSPSIAKLHNLNISPSLHQFIPFLQSSQLFENNFNLLNMVNTDDLAPFVYVDTIPALQAEGIDLLSKGLHATETKLTSLVHEENRLMNRQSTRYTTFRYIPAFDDDFLAMYDDITDLFTVPLDWDTKTPKERQEWLSQTNGVLGDVEVGSDLWMYKRITMMLDNTNERVNQLTADKTVVQTKIRALDDPNALPGVYSDEKLSKHKHNPKYIEKEFAKLDKKMNKIQQELVSLDHKAKRLLKTQQWYLTHLHSDSMQELRQSNHPDYKNLPLPLPAFSQSYFSVDKTAVGPKIILPYGGNVLSIEDQLFARTERKFHFQTQFKQALIELQEDCNNFYTARFKQQMSENDGFVEDNSFFLDYNTVLLTFASKTLESELIQLLAIERASSPTATPLRTALIPTLPVNTMTIQSILNGHFHEYLNYSHDFVSMICAEHYPKLYPKSSLLPFLEEIKIDSGHSGGSDYTPIEKLRKLLQFDRPTLTTQSFEQIRNVPSGGQVKADIASISIQPTRLNNPKKKQKKNENGYFDKDGNFVVVDYSHDDPFSLEIDDDEDIIEVTFDLNVYIEGVMLYIGNPPIQEDNFDPNTPTGEPNDHSIISSLADKLSSKPPSLPTPGSYIHAAGKVANQYTEFGRAKSIRDWQKKKAQLRLRDDPLSAYADAEVVDLHEPGHGKIRRAGANAISKARKNKNGKKAPPLPRSKLLFLQFANSTDPNNDFNRSNYAQLQDGVSDYEEESPNSPVRDWTLEDMDHFLLNNPLTLVDPTSFLDTMDHLDVALRNQYKSLFSSNIQQISEEQEHISRQHAQRMIQRLTKRYTTLSELLSSKLDAVEKSNQHAIRQEQTQPIESAWAEREILRVHRAQRFQQQFSRMQRGELTDDEFDDEGKQQDLYEGYTTKVYKENKYGLSDFHRQFETLKRNDLSYDQLNEMYMEAMQHDKVKNKSLRGDQLDAATNELNRLNDESLEGPQGDGLREEFEHSSLIDKIDKELRDIQRRIYSIIHQFSTSSKRSNVRHQNVGLDENTRPNLHPNDQYTETFHTHYSRYIHYLQKDAEPNSNRTTPLKTAKLPLIARASFTYQYPVKITKPTMREQLTNKITALRQIVRNFEQDAIITNMAVKPDFSKEFQHIRSIFDPVSAVVFGGQGGAKSTSPNLWGELMIIGPESSQIDNNEANGNSSDGQRKLAPRQTETPAPNLVQFLQRLPSDRQLMQNNRLLSNNIYSKAVIHTMSTYNIDLHWLQQTNPTILSIDITGETHRLNWLKLLCTSVGIDVELISKDNIWKQYQFNINEQIEKNYRESKKKKNKLTIDYQQVHKAQQYNPFATARLMQGKGYKGSHSVFQHMASVMRENPADIANHIQNGTNTPHSTYKSFNGAEPVQMDDGSISLHAGSALENALDGKNPFDLHHIYSMYDTTINTKTNINKYWLKSHLRNIQNDIEPLLSMSKANLGVIDMIYQLLDTEQNLLTFFGPDSYDIDQMLEQQEELEHDIIARQREIKIGKNINRRVQRARLAEDEELREELHRMRREARKREDAGINEELVAALEADGVHYVDGPKPPTSAGSDNEHDDGNTNKKLKPKRPSNSPLVDRLNQLDEQDSDNEDTWINLSDPDEEILELMNMTRDQYHAYRATRLDEVIEDLSDVDATQTSDPEDWKKPEDNNDQVGKDVEGSGDDNGKARRKRDNDDYNKEKTTSDDDAANSKGKKKHKFNPYGDEFANNPEYDPDAVVDDSPGKTLKQTEKERAREARREARLKKQQALFEKPRVSTTNPVLEKHAAKPGQGRSTYRYIYKNDPYSYSLFLSKLSLADLDESKIKFHTISPEHSFESVHDRLPERKFIRYYDAGVGVLSLTFFQQLSVFVHQTAQYSYMNETRLNSINKADTATFLQDEMDKMEEQLPGNEWLMGLREGIKNNMIDPNKDNKDDANGIDQPNGQIKPTKVRKNTTHRPIFGNLKQLALHEELNWLFAEVSDPPTPEQASSNLARIMSAPQFDIANYTQPPTSFDDIDASGLFNGEPKRTLYAGHSLGEITALASLTLDYNHLINVTPWAQHKVNQFTAKPYEYSGVLSNQLTPGGANQIVNGTYINPNNDLPIISRKFKPLYNHYPESLQSFAFDESNLSWDEIEMADSGVFVHKATNAVLDPEKFSHAMRLKAPLQYLAFITPMDQNSISNQDLAMPGVPRPKKDDFNPDYYDDDDAHINNKQDPLLTRSGVPLHKQVKHTFSNPQQQHQSYYFMRKNLWYGGQSNNPEMIADPQNRYKMSPQDNSLNPTDYDVNGNVIDIQQKTIRDLDSKEGLFGNVDMGKVLSGALPDNVKTKITSESNVQHGIRLDQWLDTVLLRGMLMQAQFQHNAYNNQPYRMIAVDPSRVPFFKNVINTSKIRVDQAESAIAKWWNYGIEQEEFFSLQHATLPPIDWDQLALDFDVKDKNAPQKPKVLDDDIEINHLLHHAERIFDNVSRASDPNGIADDITTRQLKKNQVRYQHNDPRGAIQRRQRNIYRLKKIRKHIEMQNSIINNDYDNENWNNEDPYDVSEDEKRRKKGDTRRNTNIFKHFDPSSIKNRPYNNPAMRQLMKLHFGQGDNASDDNLDSDEEYESYMNPNRGRGKHFDDDLFDDDVGDEQDADENAALLNPLRRAGDVRKGATPQPRQRYSTQFMNQHLVDLINTSAPRLEEALMVPLSQYGLKTAKRLQKEQIQERVASESPLAQLSPTELNKLIDAEQEEYKKYLVETLGQSAFEKLNESLDKHTDRLHQLIQQPKHKDKSLTELYSIINQETVMLKRLKREERYSTMTQEEVNKELDEDVARRKKLNPHLTPRNFVEQDILTAIAEGGDSNLKKTVLEHPSEAGSRLDQAITAINLSSDVKFVKGATSPQFDMNSLDYKTNNDPDSLLDDILKGMNPEESLAKSAMNQTNKSGETAAETTSQPEFKATFRPATSATNDSSTIEMVPEEDKSKLIYDSVIKREKLAKALQQAHSVLNDPQKLAEIDAEVDMLEDAAKSSPPGGDDDSGSNPSVAKLQSALNPYLKHPIFSQVFQFLDTGIDEHAAKDYMMYQNVKQTYEENPQFKALLESLIQGSTKVHNDLDAIEMYSQQRQEMPWAQNLLGFLKFLTTPTDPNLPKELYPPNVPYSYKYEQPIDRQLSPLDRAALHSERKHALAQMKTIRSLIRRVTPFLLDQGQSPHEIAGVVNVMVRKIHRIEARLQATQKEVYDKNNLSPEVNPISVQREKHRSKLDARFAEGAELSSDENEQAEDDGLLTPLRATDLIPRQTDAVRVFNPKEFQKFEMKQSERLYQEYSRVDQLGPTLPLIVDLQQAMLEQYVKDRSPPSTHSMVEQTNEMIDKTAIFNDPFVHGLTVIAIQVRNELLRFVMKKIAELYPTLTSQELQLQFPYVPYTRFALDIANCNTVGKQYIFTGETLPLAVFTHVLQQLQKDVTLDQMLAESNVKQTQSNNLSADGTHDPNSVIELHTNSMSGPVNSYSQVEVLISHVIAQKLSPIFDSKKPLQLFTIPRTTVSVTIQGIQTPFHSSVFAQNLFSFDDHQRYAYDQVNEDGSPGGRITDSGRYHNPSISKIDGLEVTNPDLKLAQSPHQRLLSRFKSGQLDTDISSLEQSQSLIRSLQANNDITEEDARAARFKRMYGPEQHDNTQTDVVYTNLHHIFPKKTIHQRAQRYIIGHFSSDILANNLQSLLDPLLSTTSAGSDHILSRLPADLLKKDPRLQSVLTPKEELRQKYVNHAISQIKSRFLSNYTGELILPLDNSGYTKGGVSASSIIAHKIGQQLTAPVLWNGIQKHLVTHDIGRTSMISFEGIQEQTSLQKMQAEQQRKAEFKIALRQQLEQQIVKSMNDYDQDTFSDNVNFAASKMSLMTRPNVGTDPNDPTSGLFDDSRASNPVSEANDGHVNDPSGAPGEGVDTSKYNPLGEDQYGHVGITDGNVDLLKQRFDMKSNFGLPTKKDTANVDSELLNSQHMGMKFIDESNSIVSPTLAEIGERFREHTDSLKDMLSYDDDDPIKAHLNALHPVNRQRIQLLFAKLYARAMVESSEGVIASADLSVKESTLEKKYGGRTPEEVEQILERESQFRHIQAIERKVTSGVKKSTQTMYQDEDISVGLNQLLVKLEERQKQRKEAKQKQQEERQKLSLLQQQKAQVEAEINARKAAQHNAKNSLTKNDKISDKNNTNSTSAITDDIDTRLYKGTLPDTALDDSASKMAHFTNLIDKLKQIDGDIAATPGANPSTNQFDPKTMLSQIQELREIMEKLPEMATSNPTMVKELADLESQMKALSVGQSVLGKKPANTTVNNSTDNNNDNNNQQKVQNTHTMTNAETRQIFEQLDSLPHDPNSGVSKEEHEWFVQYFKQNPAEFDQVVTSRRAEVSNLRPDTTTTALSPQTTTQGSSDINKNAHLTPEELNRHHDLDDKIRQLEQELQNKPELSKLLHAKTKEEYEAIDLTKLSDHELQTFVAYELSQKLKHERSQAEGNNNNITEDMIVDNVVENKNKNNNNANSNKNTPIDNNLNQEDEYKPGDEDKARAAMIDDLERSLNIGKHGEDPMKDPMFNPSVEDMRHSRLSHNPLGFETDNRTRDFADHAKIEEDRIDYTKERDENHMILQGSFANVLMTKIHQAEEQIAKHELFLQLRLKENISQNEFLQSILSNHEKKKKRKGKSLTGQPTESITTTLPDGTTVTDAVIIDNHGDNNNDEEEQEHYTALTEAMKNEISKILRRVETVTKESQASGNDLYKSWQEILKKNEQVAAKFGISPKALRGPHAAYFTMNPGETFQDAYQRQQDLVEQERDELIKILEQYDLSGKRNPLTANSTSLVTPHGPKDNKVMIDGVEHDGNYYEATPRTLQEQQDDMVVDHLLADFASDDEDAQLLLSSSYLDENNQSGLRNASLLRNQHHQTKRQVRAKYLQKYKDEYIRAQKRQRRIQESLQRFNWDTFDKVNILEFGVEPTLTKLTQTLVQTMKRVTSTKDPLYDTYKDIKEQSMFDNEANGLIRPELDAENSLLTRLLEQQNQDGKGNQNIQDQLSQERDLFGGKTMAQYNQKHTISDPTKDVLAFRDDLLANILGSTGEVNPNENQQVILPVDPYAIDWDNLPLDEDGHEILPRDHFGNVITRPDFRHKIDEGNLQLYKIYADDVIYRVHPDTTEFGLHFWKEVYNPSSDFGKM